MRYFIEIAYHGAAYCGWQKQPDVLSVQEVLEQKLTTLLRNDITVMGAGRTDAGVHAKQLFAHFDSPNNLETKELVLRLNSFLPKDISVQHIVEVIPDAHARFHAVAREYEYHIELSKNPFATGLVHQIHHTPNVVLMNEAATLLLGYQDFQCFSRSNTDVKTYYCDVKNASWQLDGSSLKFTISADRFLRNMVRAIVGTLLDVGFNKTTIDDFKTIIKEKDRTKAGASAPAKGLYLTKVIYPESIFKN